MPTRPPPVRAALAALALPLALALVLGTARAQPADAPYPVEIWARVLFGADGTPQELSLVDEAGYPAKFVDNVKQRLARARILPPQQDGKPATLSTPVRIDFIVTPTAQGGSVRLSGLAMGPMPVKKYLASYPQDLAQTGGWEGEVSAVCTVGVQGRCTAIEVMALPGMPESARRHVRASLEGWTFQPQLLNGQPIEGEYRMSIILNTLQGAPEDFRQDKFQRIINGR